MELSGPISDDDDDDDDDCDDDDDDDGVDVCVFYLPGLSR